MKKAFVFPAAAFLLAAFPAGSLELSAAGGFEEDLAFLKAHMPEKDRGVVSEEYLRENTRLAREARKAAPWRDSITDEIFREYILPYSSIGEDVDPWRPGFREKFMPLVRNCKTPGEAVALINSKIGSLLGVHYSPDRDRPDQSPFHSMRIGKASCTGLAILQVDVYRACGIPARFVGCVWSTIPGNHSWAEYYDNGTWHFFNDPADGKIAPPDVSWFAQLAAQADASNPRTRIYASRWSPSPGGTKFLLAWKRDGTSMVNADDITASYAKLKRDVPVARIDFTATDESGKRVPVGLRLLLPGTGEVAAEGVTCCEPHDLNDFFHVVRPENTCLLLQTRNGRGEYSTRGFVKFEKGRKLVNLGAK